MSLSIDTRCISGIYALGQWFAVEPGSLYLDAYELMDFPSAWVPFGSEHDIRSAQDRERGDPPHPPHRIDYQMGEIYRDTQPEFRRHTSAANPRWSQQSPAGAAGVRFKLPHTDEWVSFSLLEVRAFRECSKESVMKADDRYRPKELSSS